MRIDYLNHASVLVRTDGVALLSDPWLEGTAFSGGWGLRYANPDALDCAAEASHLWISHWHSDHLHPATLARLAQRNPRIVVLANVSANFSMVDRMRGVGFDNVVPLPERVVTELAPGVTVERFPTAGIDNALLLRTPSVTLLNYNDCNLPGAAVRALRKKIGPIDVLLNNYNHAGKLYRVLAPEAQKQELLRTFCAAADLLAPRLLVPFASSHFYRCADSRDQNASLLTFDDLEQRLASDGRLVVLRVGDAVDVDTPSLQVTRRPRVPALCPQPDDVLEYTAKVAWDELVATADAHCARLRQGFPVLSRNTSALFAHISDHGRVLELDCRRGAREADAGTAADITACSQPLHDWLGRRFGADTFIAGAHFGLLRQDTAAIERWALLTLLEASHMTERDAFRYLGTRAGRGFLWCRREEITATILGRRFKAGQIRL
jgi:L-ascorbate metabolism protein UlaG (beta-lactamase superfamily)